MHELLSKFEAPKEAPKPKPRERYRSALDAPRPELTDQAKNAQRASASRVSANAQKSQRVVPRIKATDSPVVRRMKEDILAKEKEIMELTNKLADLSKRLERVVETFSASTIEVAQEKAPSPRKDAEPVKAFHENTEAVAAKAVQAETPRSSVSSEKTSLAAILAAARGGTPRATSATPKYSKILADFK